MHIKEYRTFLIRCIPTTSKPDCSTRGKDAIYSIISNVLNIVCSKNNLKKYETAKLHINILESCDS